MDSLVQARLASFVTVFTGHDVLTALEECSSAATLPVVAGETLVQTWSRIEHFIFREVVFRGRNPYSIRFRTIAHNTIRGGVLKHIRDIVQSDARQIISQDEVCALVDSTSYKTKMLVLSRLRGYGAEGENFSGKNLLNVLQWMSTQHSQLRSHGVTDWSDHPDGPGGHLKEGRAAGCTPPPR